MREYARLETKALLQRLAIQVDRGAGSPEADSVHDLRVAIRRLSRCVGVFAQFYPRQSGRKLRQQLSTLMDAAGAVRDLDVAIALLGEAGLSRRTAAVVRLNCDRRKQSRAFVTEVRHWKSRRLPRGWRHKLEL
jgi:CHAD domain-containing protein